MVNKNNKRKKEESDEDEGGWDTIALYPCLH